MNILLTGSTGFLGFRTLEKLVELPEINKITATGRNLIDSRKVLHPKVEYVLGDLSNENFVESLFKEVDIVINTASLSSPWGEESLFIQSNIITQKNIIKYSDKYNVQRVVYISTPSIYYNGKDRLLVKESESLPDEFVNNYSRTKRKAEILLEKSNLKYIIIRPRAIIGRGDSVIMPRLIKAHSENKLMIIGEGKNLVDLTSVENVVESIILSLNAPKKALNNTYNITDGNPVYLWEVINIVLTGIGKSKIEKKISFNLAYVAASLLEMVSKYFTKKEPSLTRYSVGVLSKNFTLDISKARTLLNYTPKVNTTDTINDFIKWYNEDEENKISS